MTAFIIIFVLGLAGFVFAGYSLENERFVSTDITLLLPTNPTESSKLRNDQFMKAATKSGFRIFQDINEDTGLSATISKSNIFPNIINLDVSFQNKTNVDERLKEIKEFNKSDLICVINCDVFMSYAPEAYLKVNTNCSDSIYQVNGEVITESVHPRPVLVHENLMKYKGLIEIIEKPDIYPKIVVCKPKISQNNEFPMYITDMHTYILEGPYELKIQDCNIANAFPDDAMAVLANEPLATASEVPTIFYQTPYIYPEFKVDFPNSVDLSPPWQTLKFALVQFLRRMNWLRVAILSDDSVSSQEFSEDLIHFFKEEGDFYFLALECEGGKCNFTKALETLREAEAKIIILNIEESNSHNLISAMKIVPMTYVKWVVRGWPFAANQLDHISVSFRADMFSLNQYSIFDHTVQENYAYVSTMIECFKIIKDVYQLVLGDVDEFRRIFATRANNMQRIVDATITQVSLLNRRYVWSQVSDISVVGTKATLLSFTLSDEEIALDTNEDCLIRSQNYFHPCQNLKLLLLMTVLVMFSLSLLAIVVFFNYYRSHPQYSRFQ